MTQRHPMENIHPRSAGSAVAHSHAVQTQVFRQGPLPPPEDLKGYNDVLPGAADRILAMAEGEQKHRHGMEERDLKYRASLTGLGQILGFTLGLAAIVGGVVLLGLGRNIAGFGTLILAVASLTAAFLYGRKVSSPQSASARASSGSSPTLPPDAKA